MMTKGSSPHEPWHTPRHRVTTATAFFSPDVSKGCLLVDWGPKREEADRLFREQCSRQEPKAGKEPVGRGEVSGGEGTRPAGPENAGAGPGSLLVGS